MILNHKLVLGTLFAAILLPATMVGLNSPVMAQGSDKSIPKDLSQINLEEILKALNGNKGGNTADKNFETITVSNTVKHDSPLKTITVNCPDNTKITGGGFDGHPEIQTGGGFTVYTNKPIENGWQVTVFGEGPPSIDFTVYAQCGKLVNAGQ